jgi:hypothetical protein
MQFIPEQLTSIAHRGGKGPASAQSAVLRPVRTHSLLTLAQVFQSEEEAAAGIAFIPGQPARLTINELVAMPARAAAYNRVPVRTSHERKEG